MVAAVETMALRGSGAWHGIGRVVEALSIEDALRQGGCDWTVSLERMYYGTGTAVEDYRVVIRDSDRSQLGVVGKRYVPFQNAEALKFFQPFVDSGHVDLEVVGSLFSGRRVFILAKVRGADAEVVAGDEVRAYLCVFNGHDGKISVGVMFTPIRVVCNNTLQAAIDSADATRCIQRIRHSRSMKDRLDDVQESIDITRQQFSRSVDEFRAMSRKQLSVKQTQEYVLKCLAPEKLAEIAKLTASIEGSADFDALLAKPAAIGDTPIRVDRSMTPEQIFERSDVKAPRAFSRVMEKIETGAGSDIPGVRGTAWGAYNAVTEWIDHDRGHNPESTINASWFGPGAMIRERAHKNALAMV